MYISVCLSLCLSVCVQWGEGAGGGWFRVQRGTDALGLESHACSWAVPNATDVARALQQFDSTVAK